jgi:hypothetical protein
MRKFNSKGGYVLPRSSSGIAKHPRAIDCLLISGLCFMVLPLAVFSQTTAGLTGTVTDSSGAVMPGAKVTLTSSETGAQREGLSNESGAYEFTALLPGGYRLTIQKEGFAKVTRKGIRLEVSQVARVDVSLPPGAVSENIEVTGFAPPLETSTSSVGQVVESKAVSDLPLNGRNFAQLAILGTGAIGVGSGPTGTIRSGTRPDDPRPGNIIPAARFDPVDSRVIQAYPLATLPALINNQFTNPVRRAGKGKRFDLEVVQYTQPPAVRFACRDDRPGGGGNYHKCNRDATGHSDWPQVLKPDFGGSGRYGL